MSSFLSLLKILSVPVVIAALHHLTIFGLGRFNMIPATQNLVLSTADAARSLFLTQATVTLLMTLFVGLPYMRSVARRRDTDFQTWMMAWVFVHLPTFGLSIIANGFVAKDWVRLLSLIVSFVLVTGLWWNLFYAEPESEVNRGV